MNLFKEFGKIKMDSMLATNNTNNLHVRHMFVANQKKAFTEM